MWNDSSEATGKILPALSKALGEMSDVTKDAKVNAGQMRYTYATLSAVLDVTRPALARHELAVMQTAMSTGDGPAVVTTIIHSSGEWLSLPALCLRAQQATPQAAGSAISFARRYALLAALGLATEDDDGQQASHPARRQADDNEPSGEVATAAADAPADKSGLMAAVALYQRYSHVRDTPTGEKVRGIANGRKLTASSFQADPVLSGQVAAILDEVAA